MPQYLINLSELQALLNEAKDANRVLITIDTPASGSGNGKTKATPTIKARAVSFLNGGLIENESIDLATQTMALSLDARANREISGCPYPPGC